MSIVKIGNKAIGEGEDVFITAEIGINHNGSIEIAKKLIDVAADAGCDAVKFQKRTVDVVYTKEELDKPRESPWGDTNREQKECLEFNRGEYDEIDRYCEKKKILWYASCWDEGSVEFISRYDPPCYKVPSALLTNDNLLKCTKFRGKPIILSTGMSTMDEIEYAVDILGQEDLVILHCISTYPANVKELNLRVIQTLKNKFNCPIGYSGHEVGLLETAAAVVLGACAVERHITLDRTMYGSDQASSIEPYGVKRLVKDIREISLIMGDGKKRVYESEIPIKKKLRRR